MLLETESWCVVGGGMLGMTLALRLAQRGRQVTLLEEADHLGGLADAWQLGDVTWDRHYHVTLLSDQFLRSLLNELGLADEMKWVETKTGFYVDGRLHSLSNSWEFLKFPPLNLLDKFRLGATIFYASRIRDGRPLEAVPVGEWLRKLSGERVFRRIWSPLLKAKLGDNHERASASFIWSTIQRMYAARRTGLKKEMFGYVAGGYEQVLQRLEAKLRLTGVKIQTSFSTRTVETRNEGGFRIVSNSGDSVASDRVVLTTPPRVAAELCPDLAHEERNRLRNVEYQGIVCASLLLKEPLGPFYVTNITDDWVPFTGVIEMTALVDRRQFGGRTLVYLPKYLPAEHPMYQESDGSIRERFTSALARMYAHFSPDDVEAFRVSRARNVMPLPTLNYSDRLPAVASAVPGLFFVNAAHIVNGTLNVNETIKLAEESLPALLTPKSAQRRNMANETKEGEHAKTTR